MAINIINPYGTVWTAEITNTPISYYFKGSDSQESYSSVKKLAEEMQNGQDALATNISDIFSRISGSDVPLDPANPADAGEIVQTLFGEQSELLWQGARVFLAEGDDILADLVEAGGDLLAAL